MFTLLFANVRTALTVLAISLFGGLCIYASYSHSKIVKLEKENQTLQQTQKTQENIITITDENETKNTKLASDVNSKINEVKAKLLAKNQEDFLKKSECIFSNFGNKDYECK